MTREEANVTYEREAIEVLMTLSEGTFTSDDGKVRVRPLEGELAEVTGARYGCRCDSCPAPTDEDLAHPDRQRMWPRKVCRHLSQAVEFVLLHEHRHTESAS